jgi:putative tricarboxylic transport membrane protein
VSPILEAAWQGLLLVLTWPNPLYPVIGTLLVMLFVFLPGLGGVTLMAIALPLTLSWDPTAVALLFAAFVGGGTFMGSITAILFNVPGSGPNAATLLDGYPMAERGEAKTAIGCAASASALGATFGIVVLILLLPLVRLLILSFGPMEFLLLAIWGLTTIAMVSGGSGLKGLIMAGLGLMVSFVGLDPRTAEARYTFGIDQLVDGVAVVPVLLGVFALAEMIGLAVSGRRTISGKLHASELSGSLAAGCLAPLRYPGLLLRSSVIGTVIGIIPGIGGTVAGFVAYGHAVQSVRDAPRFGAGDVRGVLAPEAANDAKDGGSFLPVLAFGLPGSESTVLFLAALTLHGIVPGRQLMEHDLALVFALIWVLFISNWLTSLVGLAVSGQLARITVIRTDLIVPAILALVAVAAVLYRGRLDDLLLVVGFGILGHYLKRFGWPRIPFLIALVLGSMFEVNLHLTLRLVELGRLRLWDRPIALALCALVLVSVALPFLRRRGGDPPAIAGMAAWRG